MSEIRKFDFEEYNEILRGLEKYHSVFSRLWSMGIPCFSKEQETMAVSFDKMGETIQFVINEEFWSKLTRTQKEFCLCHEMLHIILNHGIRITDAKDICTNVALDVVVNQILLGKFGFKRKDIGENFCWIDKIFGDKISKDQCFEFYYNKLKEILKQMKQKGDGKGGSGGSGGANNGLGDLVDDHSGLEGSEEGNEEVIKKLNDEMLPEEKQGIKDVIDKYFEKGAEGRVPGGKQAGTEAGNLWYFAVVGKVQKKRKWETVIKNWVTKHIKESTKETEQWVRTNRRFACVCGDLIIPTEMEVDESEQENHRIDVWFFQDTSGSCTHLKDRFFAAALSIPEDKFNVKLFCFDTRVYEVDINTKKLYGFGGTSFSIIHDYIEQHRDKKKEYPTVFVITDGYGNNVNPIKPKLWYWFLSENNRYHIPKECNIFMLKDFE